MLQIDYEKLGIDPVKIVEENNSQLQEMIDYCRDLARIHQRLGNTKDADRCLFLARQQQKLIRNLGV